MNATNTIDAGAEARSISRQAALPSLRPYQENLVSELRKALSKDRSVVACMPPGGGKTRVAKFIMGSYLNRAKRPTESGNAAFMVHRRGLVQNASDSFSEEPLLRHGLIMSGCETSAGCELQVVSIDTKNSWYIEGAEYTTEFTYDLLIFDEIHSHVAKFRTFLDAHNAKRKELGLEPPFVLGLSATPQHEELNKVFAKIVNGPSPSWLIENGYLSSFRYFKATQGKLDLLVKRGDEFTDKSVAAAMAGLAGNLVSDWKRLALGRATVGFFPRRSHAREAMEMLQAAGVEARYVDGKTSDDDRNKLFQMLSNGEIDYICNVGVIERGTDIPRVSCIQLCTAIGSVVRYRQMIGRGSRVHPDKDCCLVIDHADNVSRHGFFEDDIAWTLQWGERPSKTHNPRATIDCPQCGAVYRGGKCRACGYEPTQKERMAKGLQFVGGELQEVKRTASSNRKPMTNEKIMVGALYRAGKTNGSFGAAWRIALSMARKQNTNFVTPATFEVAGRVYKVIPFGNKNATRSVADMYGFTVGKYSDRDNPFRIK